MKKILFVTLAILVSAVILSISAFAAVTSVASPPGAFTSGGWSLFSLPAIPTEPQPGLIFNELGGDWGLETRNLYRFDAPSQSLWQFSAWEPETFGNLLIGDGYWIRLRPGDPSQIAFTGITDNDATDMWISLPRTGWTLIGHPYSYPLDPIASPYPWSSVKVTDGTVTKTMYQASRYGSPVGEAWVNSNAFWFDSATQSLSTMGLPDDWPESESLAAWHGYWVQSYKDNIALIFEAAPPSP